VTIVTGNRSEALARLDVFVGEWVVEAWFPGQPAPPGAAGDGPVARSWFEWALGLDFRQRFTGTFSADGNTISGAWETGRDGGQWEHDFALTYRRAG
jgi:hypothetical protein